MSLEVHSLWRYIVRADLPHLWTLAAAPAQVICLLIMMHACPCQMVSFVIDFGACSSNHVCIIPASQLLCWCPEELHRFVCHIQYCVHLPSFNRRILSAVFVVCAWCTVPHNILPLHQMLRLPPIHQLTLWTRSYCPRLTESARGYQPRSICFVVKVSCRENIEESWKSVSGHNLASHNDTEGHVNMADWPAHYCVMSAIGLVCFLVGKFESGREMHTRWQSPKCPFGAQWLMVHCKFKSWYFEPADPKRTSNGINSYVGTGCFLIDTLEIACFDSPGRNIKGEFAMICEQQGYRSSAVWSAIKTLEELLLECMHEYCSHASSWPWLPCKTKCCVWKLLVMLIIHNLLKLSRSFDAQTECSCLCYL